MIRKGWFYIYGIIYVTAVDLRISKHEGNDRSVNLALDTVLEFNHKDNGGDMSFLDNVQKFIGKVKTVIAKKSLKRRNFNSVNNEKLTDFILNLIQVLYKFTDTDLEYFFDITADEMRKYHYKGCKFHELTANTEFRKSLATKLALIKNAPASVLRRKLDAISNKIEEEMYDRKEKDLIDFINSLYGENSVTIFHRTLSNLDDYRLKTRVNMNLQKIISNAIRSVLFDYYTELNNNARMAMQAKLNEYYKNDIKDTVKDFEVQDIKTSKTTKKATTNPKYIKQYVHSKYGTFKDNKKSPKEIVDDRNIAALASRVTFKEVASIQVHSKELRHHKRKKHAEKFNKQQQFIHNKKPKSHTQDYENMQYKTKHNIKTSRTVLKPYFKKETIDKYDLYARERSKIDNQVNDRTSRSIHPITSPIMEEFTRAETIPIDADNSQNREYIKYKKHSYKTPKEPDIEVDTYQNEELLNPKTTNNHKRTYNIFREVKTTVKPQLINSRHQKYAKSELRNLNIAATDRQKIVTLYPLNSDLESNLDPGELKQRVDRLYVEKVVRYSKEPKHNLDLELHFSPRKTNNSADGSHKYSDTDNISNDDKLRHNVKNPTNNFKLIEKLEVIQKRGRDDEFYNTEHSTRPTIGTDSVEFIAFEDDDLGGIDERLKVNSKHKVKLPNTRLIHRITPKKTINRMYKRAKSNKLTFMTLYPEFIQKWTTSNPLAAFRSQNDNSKKKTKHRNREEKSVIEPKLPFIDNMSPHIPQGIQNIINAKSATRAKTIDVIFQTKDIQFKRANANYKATTSESNKNKGIQIIQENLKRLSNPEVYAKRLGLIAPRGNKANSEDSLYKEDSLEKTQPTNPRRRSKNTSKAGPFIDLNYLSKTQMNTGANIDKYINNTPKKKEMKVDSLYDDETIPQNKEETVNDNSAGEIDIIKFNLRRTPKLGRMEAHYSVKNKESTKNAIEIDKQRIQSYRNGLKITEDNDAITLNGKEFTLETFNSEVDKHRKSRRGFVEIQRPLFENIDVPEVISKQEVTNYDRKPKYTSNQPTKRDITLNTVHYTQNYNEEIYDASTKKKILFSDSNDVDVTTDRITNNAVDKLVNENEYEPAKSVEENVKYSSYKNTLGYEKESNDIKREPPKLLPLSSNKEITNIQPDQNIQGTSDSEKDKKTIQNSITIKNVEEELLKFDKENTVNKIYTKTPIEKEVKARELDNYVIQRDREVKESEITFESPIDSNEKLIKTQDTTIRPTTQNLEHFSATENDLKKEPSTTFMFRAKNDDSLENIKHDSSNIKSSVTYVEPDTVPTTTTEKIATRSTNYDIKMKTETTKMTTSINELNKHTDSKFTSTITEITQRNTDSKKIDTFTEETSFIRPVSQKKPILDNLTNAIRNLDGFKENTNATFKNFNGTTTSFN